MLRFLLWRRQGAPRVALALTSSITSCGLPGPGGLVACALRNHGTARLDFVLVHVSVRTQQGPCVPWPSVQTGTQCFLFLPHSATPGAGSCVWSLQRLPPPLPRKAPGTRCQELGVRILRKVGREPRPGSLNSCTSSAEPPVCGNGAEGRLFVHSKPL